jgi:hypothetical protein
MNALPIQSLVPRRNAAPLHHPNHPTARMNLRVPIRKVNASGIPFNFHPIHREKISKQLRIVHFFSRLD